MVPAIVAMNWFPTSPLRLPSNAFSSTNIQIAEHMSPDSPDLFKPSVIKTISDSNLSCLIDSEMSAASFRHNIFEI